MNATTIAACLKATPSEIAAVDAEPAHDSIRAELQNEDRDISARQKAELTRAFAASEASYRPLTAAQVIARNSALLSGINSSVSAKSLWHKEKADPRPAGT